MTNDAKMARWVNLAPGQMVKAKPSAEDHEASPLYVLARDHDAALAAAYEAAANLPAVRYSNVVDRNAIRALTPADAKAALEARDAAMRLEGMAAGLRLAEVACLGLATAQAARQAIIAQKEKLK